MVLTIWTFVSKVMSLIFSMLSKFVIAFLPRNKCLLISCSSWIRKGRGTRDRIANNHWIIEKAREFQKNSDFGFIDYAKDFV